MSTTQVAATLFQLQQLDLELDRLTSELQAVQQSLQGSERLQKARMERQIAQQQLEAGLQAQKEAEWVLEDLSRRLQAQERRLFNGTVSNPKELSSLQQEVQRLRAQHQRQEEITLQEMDIVEAAQEVEQRKAEVLHQAEEAWQKESRSLQEKRDQQEKRRQDLLAKRTVLAGGIDAVTVQRYETMRRTKQGRAVSKVEQSSCQWCRVILTPSELQRVRISGELQTCTNCGRILYYDR